MNLENLNTFNIGTIKDISLSYLLKIDSYPSVREYQKSNNYTQERLNQELRKFTLKKHHAVYSSEMENVSSEYGIDVQEMFQSKLVNFFLSKLTEKELKQIYYHSGKPNQFLFSSSDLSDKYNEFNNFLINSFSYISETYDWILLPNQTFNQLLYENNWFAMNFQRLEKTPESENKMIQYNGNLTIKNKHFPVYTSTLFPFQNDPKLQLIFGKSDWGEITFLPPNHEITKDLFQIQPKNGEEWDVVLGMYIKSIYPTKRGFMRIEIS